MAKRFLVMERELILTSLSHFKKPNSVVGNFLEQTESPLFQLVNLIKEGAFLKALKTQIALEILKFVPNLSSSEFLEDSPAVYYSSIKGRLNSLCNGNWRNVCGLESLRELNLAILSLGVSSLYIFLQANITGPSNAESSLSSQELFSQQEKYSQTEKEEVSKLWDTWARKDLMVDGSDAVGKYYLPQYLVLAKILLLTPPTDSSSDLLSRPWWALRVLMLHQRILSETSPTLRREMVGYAKTLLERFGSIESANREFLDWGEGYEEGRKRHFFQILAAEAHVEVGIMEHIYGHTDAARNCFQRAAGLCELVTEVTGVMGFRTKYQVDAKAQMTLKTTSGLTEGQDPYDSEIDEENITNQMISKNKANGESGNQDSALGKIFSGESDILLNPKVLEEGKAGDEGRKGREEMDSAEAGKEEDEIVHREGGRSGGKLSSVEQAIVLGLSLDVRKNNPDDELRSWQLAPYIEAVGSQETVRPMLKASCELLRVRWERLRSRTRERALCNMEKIVSGIRDGESGVSQRIRYSFAVWLPTWAALQKEYGELLVSNGMVGEALLVFEQLELWDSLIDLYSFLDKRSAATELVKERLKFQPQDPRLWCSLGDLTFDETAYLKSWEVSGHRFARAKRSLAKAAFNRGAFEESICHWKAALAINPLHPDGWFSFGYSAMKGDDIETALHAFTRSVQLDPDNGEAWNNIAVLNLQKGKSKAAFTSLHEALKFKRDSWQMWANFTQVALDSRNFDQAIRSMKMTLDLTKNKRVDTTSMSRLVDEIEVRRGLKAAPSEEEEPSVGHEEEEEEDAFFSDFQPIALLPLPSPSSMDLPQAENTDLSADSAAVPEQENGGEIPSKSESEARQRERLENEVRLLISRVASSGEGSPEIWAIQARFFEAVGEEAVACEAHLKHVRNLQGLNWQSDRSKFLLFAKASLGLCNAHLRAAAKASTAIQGNRSRSAARLHLKNVLKQGEQFQDSEEYKELERCLEKVTAGNGKG